MVRIALIAAAFAAAFAAVASASAQEQPAPDEQRTQEVQTVRRDGFVISNDACGASQYAHLIGEPYAELHHAALPENVSFVTGKGLITLEFEPGKLNIVLNEQGRIIAIGCF